MNNKAIGMRNTVSEMLVIAGILVLPHPKKAPVVTISRHMKSCENPSTLKYADPIAMLSSSLMKIEKSASGNKMKRLEVTTPITKATVTPDLNATIS